MTYHAVIKRNSGPHICVFISIRVFFFVNSRFGHRLQIYITITTTAKKKSIFFNVTQSDRSKVALTNKKTNKKTRQ